MLCISDAINNILYSLFFHYILFFLLIFSLPTLLYTCYSISLSLSPSSQCLSGNCGSKGHQSGGHSDTGLLLEQEEDGTAPSLLRKTLLYLRPPVCHIGPPTPGPAQWAPRHLGASRGLGAKSQDSR